MVETPKTIADAINSVSEDDVDLTEDVEETQEESSEESEGTLLDEDEAEEPEEEEAESEDGEQERDHTGDVVGDDPDAEKTDGQKADAEPDVFDTLTAEEIEAIKADPALNKLRKSLMRGYSAKTQEHNQLVQLGIAYRRDPKGVAEAIAKSVGLTVVPAAATPAAPAAAPAASDPGVELEALFGPQIGPKVRAVFDKWAEARIGPRVAPLEQTLGQVTSQAEAARMANEEAQFKARHKDLTPEVEREIVALGQSGKIVPGELTPSEYLDTLYDVVMARRARAASRGAATTATKKLVTKIEANRRDREPTGVSGRGGSVKKVSRVAEAKNISEALDIAMEEMENER